MEQLHSHKTSPKDFFLYLLSNVALYYCAGWLVSLLYDYINYGFGTINYYETSWLPSSMRWAIASLVIVFPVYIWVTNGLNRDLATNPGKKDLWVRKWMMYLTLALASIAIVIDLVALVNEFLAGEFAATFILKVLAVALVSGLVFGYYFYELRRDAGKHAPARSIFRYAAIALVALTIAGGFLVVGSPTTARERRYDVQRVFDLQSIQSQVTNYWQNKRALPPALSALSDPLLGYSLPIDPEITTKQREYEYKPTGSLSFEICATFNLAGGPSDEVTGPKITGAGNEVWLHGAGRTCFNRTIDPAFFPAKGVLIPANY